MNYKNATIVVRIIGVPILVLMGFGIFQIFTHDDGFMSTIKLVAILFGIAWVSGMIYMLIYQTKSIMRNKVFGVHLIFVAILICVWLYLAIFTNYYTKQAYNNSLVRDSQQKTLLTPQLGRYEYI